MLGEPEQSLHAGFCSFSTTQTWLSPVLTAFGDCGDTDLPLLGQPEVFAKCFGILGEEREVQRGNSGSIQVTEPLGEPGQGIPSEGPAPNPGSLPSPTQNSLPLFSVDPGLSSE